MNDVFVNIENHPELETLLLSVVCLQKEQEMGNSTSKVSVRTEPYLQHTTQSLEAKNEVYEWTFGECMVT
jgi:hypothetical protein